MDSGGYIDPSAMARQAIVLPTRCARAVHTYNRRNDAELGQVKADGVDDRRLLPYEEVARRVEY